MNTLLHPKINQNAFLNGIFKTLETNQKLCIVLHDEVYVKKMLLYHGGTLFGRSVDDPSSLARTILGYYDNLSLWWAQISIKDVANIHIELQVSNRPSSYHNTSYFIWRW